MWLAERSADAAAAWYNGLVDATLTLETLAIRCPLAPESAAFAREIRQLLYGNYRILFIVVKGGVHVLHVRYCARDRVK